MLKNPRISPPAMAESSSPTVSEPPRKLGEPGLALWNLVQSEFHITDCGGVELLLQACVMADRAEELAAKIAADGVTLATQQGMRSHPCLKEEFAARRLIVGILQKLGLTEESIKPVGRPANKGGWSYADRT
jgi:hypothetical protein